MEMVIKKQIYKLKEEYSLGSRVVLKHIMRKCPECGAEYFDVPAISRKDNKEICPICGIKEALDAAHISQELQAEILDNIAGQAVSTKD